MSSPEVPPTDCSKICCPSVSHFPLSDDAPAAVPFPESDDSPLYPIYPMVGQETPIGGEMPYFDLADGKEVETRQEPLIIADSMFRIGRPRFYSEVNSAWRDGRWLDAISGEVRVAQEELARWKAGEYK